MHRRIKKAKKICLKGQNTSAAVKVALAILGVGVMAGTTLVIVMDRVMKKIFVNEDWPEDDWSSDGWADEDLEG